MREYIKDLSKEISVDITDSQIDMLLTYLDLIKEWNEKFNLTAITEDREMILKHFIDSLTILKYIDDRANVIDIGSGAGLPAIPIKIMKPDINMTMIDSVNKKVTFLNEASKELGLECKAYHGRFEDLARGDMRESFDICTARAVAPLNVLVEYAIPFLKKGGKLIAMKGQVEEEIKEAEKAIKELGATIERVEEFTLPSTDMERSIVVIKKEKDTSAKYPRKAGIPKKNPIL